MSTLAGTPFSVLTNLVLFVALTLGLGASAMRWLVIPVGHDRLERGAAAAGLASAVFLLVAMAMVFARQLAEFRDPFVPWQDDASLLLSTRWGSAWRWGVAGSLVLLGSFAAARRGLAIGWSTGALSCLAVGAFPAFTGHASSGEWTRLTIPADIVHVWTVGAWIGSLAVILLLERAERRRSGGGSVLPLLIPRFTPLALVSVALLTLTGALASWVHLESPAALVTTAHGRLLLTKLVIVSLVFALGARNFRRIAPRLSEPDGPPALRRSATWEIGLALLAIAVTAALVRTSPL